MKTKLLHDDDAFKYMERLQLQAAKKAELAENTKKLAKINTAYVKYLDANPYKEERAMLVLKHERLVQEILQLIPDANVFLRR